MFQHDFRRLALARDLLPEAVRCCQCPAAFPAADPPEAAHRGDPADHTAANQN